MKLLVINQNIPNDFSCKVKKTTNSDYFLRKGIGDKVPLFGVLLATAPYACHTGVVVVAVKQVKVEIGWRGRDFKTECMNCHFSEATGNISVKKKKAFHYHPQNVHHLI